MSGFSYSLKQGFSNMVRHRGHTLASVCTMVACIGLFCLSFMMMVNIYHIIRSAEDTVGVTVFFEKGTTSERIDEIRAEVESLGLTDEWVAEAGKKIKELLDAENGLVCIPQLTEDWLNENMPKIPMGIPWTCFLLQQLCFFYSERIGAKTLRPVGMYDFSRLHSFLLPYASPIQELSEAVWLWMVDKGWGGKTLMRSEIEDIFRDAKLIGFDDNGRCHRLDRCLDNSKYFAWNTTGSKVVVHKPTKEMIRALRG